MPQRSASENDAAPDRHDHELLQVDVVVGVLAAVQHVHHRHGQHVGVGAADVAEERQAELFGGGAWRPRATRRGWRWRRAGLVVGAVEVDEHAVDLALVECVEADDRVGDLVVDVVDGGRHALAEVIASRRRAARRPRTAPVDAPEGTAARPAAPESSSDLDLDGGVAARIEDLREAVTCGTILDDAHAERDLKAVFPVETWNRRHLQIIYFGREFCPAQRHDLLSCPICSWAATKKRIRAETGG
jgi:hypothetical protein